MGKTPVGNDPWVNTLEILIDSDFVALQESILVFISSDDRKTGDCLSKVGVDGRARNRVQAPQLSGGGHIEPLNHKEKKKI